MNEIKDCRGIVVCVGDTIVYPGRRGSALWMNVGTVVEPVFEHQYSLNVRKTNGKVVEIQDTTRVAVVTAAASV